MVLSNSYFRKVATHLLPVICAGLLVACGPATIKPSSSNAFAGNKSLRELIPMISTAERLPSPEKDRQFIDLAKQLYSLGEEEKAVSLLKKVNSGYLSDAEYLDYMPFASEIYSSQEEHTQNYTLLTAPKSVQLWSLLSKQEQHNLGQTKAQLYNTFGFYEEAFIELIKVDRRLSKKLDITENRNLIWQQLSNFPAEELNEKTQTSNDPELLGWYQLAQISKQHVGSIKAQAKALKEWQAANPSHPANQELPLDLQLLNTMIDERPRQIALLLPQSGKLAAAGKAIRDGFFAAYYNNQDSASDLKVDVFDTEKQEITALYDDAVRQGANLIIGPLQKDKVNQLMHHTISVNTLALNYVDTSMETDDGPLNSAFFQFGLSLEQEAQQVAQRAWLEGHRFAMVIANEASWSQRAASAFMDEWRTLGGVVSQDYNFSSDNDYSSSIKQALNIEQSKQRATQLKRLFGRSFEFQPRRRKDMDMIFLVSRSQDGQQIKPTLAFHYASDIPVYATSQIYSSLQSANKVKDLDGVRFSTLPWILNESTPERTAITKNIQMPPNYERLYAMGADSFLLHDKLTLFKYSPKTSIYGNTGKLHINPDQSIYREQVWAEIVEGKAQALPQLTRDGLEQEQDSPVEEEQIPVDQ